MKSLGRRFEQWRRWRTGLLLGKTVKSEGGEHLNTMKPGTAQSASCSQPRYFKKGPVRSRVSDNFSNFSISGFKEHEILNPKP